MTRDNAPQSGFTRLWLMGNSATNKKAIPPGGVGAVVEASTVLRSPMARAVYTVVDVASVLACLVNYLTPCG